jgi:hypothetical protein
MLSFKNFIYEAGRFVDFNTSKPLRRRFKKTNKKFYTAQTFGLDIEFGPFETSDNSYESFRDIPYYVMSNSVYAKYFDNDEAYEKWYDDYADKSELYDLNTERETIEKKIDELEKQIKKKSEGTPENIEEIEELKDNYETLVETLKELEEEISDWTPDDSEYTDWLEEHWHEFFNENYIYELVEDLGIETDSEISERISSMNHDILYKQGFSDIVDSIDQDGENVEITTEILTRKDLPRIKEMFEHISYNLDEGLYNTHAASSAHIHVGYPKKFDLINRLNLFVLVDEKNIVDISGRSQATLGMYSRMSKDVISKIIETFEKIRENGALVVGFTNKGNFSFLNQPDKEEIEDKEHPLRFKPLTFKEQESYIKSISNNKLFLSKNQMDILFNNYFNSHRSQGVNLTNGDHVEFRYPTSTILEDVPLLLKTIDYFMTLVNEASKENTVEFTNDDCLWIYKISFDDGRKSYVIEFIPKRYS